MPPNRRQRACLAIGLILWNSAHAIPQIAFPVNSQLPPVAYASQPFDFTFSPSTFADGTSQISYSLASQPGWLSLDGTNRRFSGTPTNADIGAPQFELIASDNEGQISSNVTLVVLEKQTIVASLGNISSELANAGVTSAPATLLLHPQQSFEFYLTRDLFGGANSDTTFYAASSDRTPLPSWLIFDAENIQFSGTTPPLLSPTPSSETFLFQLIASNVIGFSEADVQFEILIGDQLLAFNQPSYTFTVTPGSLLQTPSLLGRLTLDGSPIQRDQIASADANTPSWIYFNSSDLSFSGSVPLDVQDSAFSILVTGLGTNTANATIELQTDQNNTSQQITLGNAATVAGSYFMHTIKEPDEIHNEANISINALDLPSWLSFTPSNLTLHGLVPLNTSSEEVLILFVFTTATHSVHAILNLSIASSSGRPTSTESAKATNSVIGDSGKEGHSKNTAILILAIILPIFVVALLICIIIFWLHKQKKRKEESEKTNEIQPPNPPVQVSESETGDVLSMPGSVQPYESTVPSNQSLPQIELGWAPDSLKKTRRRLSKKPRISQNSMVGSSWDELIDYRVQSQENVPSVKEQQTKNMENPKVVTASEPAAPQIPKKNPLRSASQDSRYHIQAIEVSKIPDSTTSTVTALPDRMNGVGHGAGMNRFTINTNPRSSWQTTMGTIPMVDGRRPSSLLIGSFPAPPSSGSLHTVPSTESDSSIGASNIHPTLRIVESSSGDSWSLQAARSNQLAQRMRERSRSNTRFSGAVTRPVSLSNELNKPDDPTRRNVTRDRTRMNERNSTPRMYVPPYEPSMTRRASQSSNIQNRRRSTMQTPVSRERHMSIASSHQFDSAISSDSQWEDENLIAEEDTAGGRHWQSQTNPSSNKPSPRLPFESSKGADRSPFERRDGSESRGPRLADQRRQVGIRGSGLGRSQRSQQGSFRFV